MPVSTANQKIALTYLAHGSDIYPLLHNSLTTLRMYDKNHDVFIFYTDGTIANKNELETQFRVKCIKIRTDVEKAQYDEIGTKGFNMVTSFKWLAMLEVLKKGYDTVIFSDCDIAYLQEPFSIIRKISADYDLGFQIETSNHYPPEYCSGFMFFNKNQAQFLHQTFQINKKIRDSRNDQQAINAILRHNVELMKSAYCLPQWLFPVGSMNGLLVAEKLEMVVASIRPILIHANWVKGIENKIALLKEVGAWHR